MTSGEYSPFYRFATAKMLTDSPKRVYLETLGCAKNRTDSEIMLGALLQKVV